ncbi:SMP-30/gluconolactonase/LRE family protein [Pseudonocardia pini]|uniref:SMP-30/gluconolactonase/LRE family protein n=1 Tax=Pseudonocardia pini TaxID=2758030 RepID=UPI0015F0A3C9|nr:SMP-30/gluconolactonase/LRE family protein [Pseudonocardia pini]
MSSPARATVELRARPWLSGLAFPEGLRWHAGRLWFSDMVGRAVHTALPDGTSRVLTEVPGRPSGLGFGPDGSLWVASMRGRRVLRYSGGTDPGGDLRVVADARPAGWRALNDMLVDPATGHAYVDGYTDDDEAGAVLLVRSDGSVETAAELAYPNGLVLLPGTRELVVASTVGAELRSYLVRDDGRLDPHGVFAPLPGRSPDGLAVDAAGGVWTACYTTGEFVRVERGGAVTHRVDVGADWAVSCALGGPDGVTLYLARARTTRDRYDAGDSDGWVDVATAPVPAPA